MNFLQLPSDIVFTILVELPTVYLNNVSRICKKTKEWFSDERFWKRKVQKDYPNIDWKLYSYKSIQSFYKRLYSQSGQLIFCGNLNVNYKDIFKVIPGVITFIIDNKYNLRMLKSYLFNSTVDHDLYRMSIHIPFGSPILKNIRDFAREGDNGLFLTKRNHLYELGENKIPEEIKVPGLSCKIVGFSKKIASNVREIGCDNIISYYVTRDYKFYVRSAAHNLKTYTFVGMAKSVSLSDGGFYYVDLNNYVFSGMNKKPMLGNLVNVKQLLVNHHDVYVLMENKLLIYNRAFGEQKEFKLDIPMEKLCCKTEIYMISKRLDLYNITDGYDQISIAKNILNVFGDYHITLPLQDV